MVTEQTAWGAFASKRLAPALAASIGSYLMTQASLGGQNFALLGIDSETVKGALVFALTILFTDPMFYVRLLASGILAVRQFWSTARHEVDSAIRKPIPEDNKDAP